ncbi:MAG: glycosyltransferase family 4 protein [Planctomycetota bacterium]
MKIGMVLDQLFPPDIRVEKEAGALLNAGFTVGLLAPSDGPHTPPVETTDAGLRIYRTPVPRPSAWSRQVKGLTLLERTWLKPLEEYVAEFRPDVLHVHDFPMVKTVLRVAGPRGLPVVADLHENMPAAHRVWRASLDPVRRTKDALHHNYHLWRWHERRILPLCARVIVVVPEAAERLYAFGLDRDRIVVVSNTEDETTFRLRPPAPDVLERYRNRWVATYVGSVGPHRGVDTAVRAAPLTARQIPGFRLLVVGVRNERQIAPLQRIVRRLGAEESVEFVGWQSPDRVGAFLAASAACLVPHNDWEHTRTTVPHKLFQYMMAGKPVIVSDVRPLKRIIEETGAGLVFKANDHSDLARALVELHHDPALGEELGQKGRQAATGSHAWRHDARRLVELYRGLD